MSTHSEPEHRAEEGWRPTSRQIVGGIIVVVALVAILQNTRTGHFSFLFFDFEAPVWVWLLATFGAGFATGTLVTHRRAKQP